MTTEELTEKLADVLSEKKAENINIIDVSEKSSICDFFVIGSASNVNQLGALSDAAEEYLYKADVNLKGREGKADGGWILLDYGDIVVHLFTAEMRDFYDLDHTWKDAPSHIFGV